MRTILCRLALLVPLAFAALPAVAQETFVPGIDDLPLMPGLAADVTESVVFDKPGGRIVEAVARGAVPQAEVETFYAETLDALGWRTAGRHRFAREGEHLDLSFERAGAVLTVRFRLSPG